MWRGLYNCKDMGSKKEVIRNFGHTSSVTSVQFLNGDKIVASGAVNGELSCLTLCQET